MLTRCRRWMAAPNHDCPGFSWCLDCILTILAPCEISAVSLKITTNRRDLYQLKITRLKSRQIYESWTAQAKSSVHSTHCLCGFYLWIYYYYATQVCLLCLSPDNLANQLRRFMGAYYYVLGFKLGWHNKFPPEYILRFHDWKKGGVVWMWTLILGGSDFHQINGLRVANFNPLKGVVICG